MKRLARMARGGSQRVGPPKDRSPPKLIDAEQEQTHAEVCPPTKALESRRPTPNRRFPRQNKGGLNVCGMGQEGGKENVDPAPSSKPPRTPRAKKVVVPPLLQVQAAEAAADVDVLICTQIPITNASTRVKRMRKERQSKALAHGGETTPKPQVSTRSRKVTTAECGLVDMTLQTPMPDCDAPNELGPPPPDSTPAPKHGGLRARSGRLSREEKGKVVRSKPRRPRAWLPPAVQPNLTEGVRTRALAAQVAEYEQQMLNDDAIHDVLRDVGGYEGLSDCVAPESQHGVGSMDTVNVNLWESVFRDDAWRTSAPISKHTGFGATHPGGSLERQVLLDVAIMPQHLHGTYVQWSCRRAGWAVLVPNRFLSEHSFHTGDTPSWTQGDVIGEGVHAATGKRMILCDLGGYDAECHLNEESVRVADGPNVRAYGSEGGHGYGWWKRQHCFSPVPDLAGVFGGLSASNFFGGTASGVGSGNGPGLTERVSENTDVLEVNPEQQGGCPIADYHAPSDTEGVDGTQDSTAREQYVQAHLKCNVIST